MIKVDTKGFEDVKQMLRQAGKDMPKATAMTLTWMGQAAKQKLTQKIPQIFDRPTRWTKGSTFLKAANMRTQQAIVYIKDGSIKSLEHHIEGDRRRPKRFERRLRSRGILPGNQFTVPGIGQKLDRSGNVSMAAINKVLSSMGAQGDRYANSSARSIKRNKGQANYFAVQKAGNLPAGIYQAKGRGASRRLAPVFIFVDHAKYKRRYPFFEIGEDAAYDAMPSAASRALDRILK